MFDDKRVIDGFKPLYSYEEPNLDDDGTPTNRANKLILIKLNISITKLNINILFSNSKCFFLHQNEIVSVIDENTNVVDLKAITYSTNSKRCNAIVDNTTNFDCSSSKTHEVVDTLKIMKMEKLE